MVERHGLAFPLVSDVGLDLIRTIGVENLEVEDLALHAVYIVDGRAKVVYRKVGRRRPGVDELIEALDYHFGSR